MTGNELKRLERATFLAAADSGLWDMFLAGIIAMLAIGPLLSERLGDYWSSAVFVPFWVAAIIAMRQVQARVILPRMGVVEFSPPRMKKLKRLGVIILAVNLVALGLGAVAATRAPVMGGNTVPLVLSLIFLLAGSLVAFLLEIPRVFFYGLLLAAAPPLGEVLFQRGQASHHGFPIVFGVSACVILASGIIRFKRFLPPPPRGMEGSSAGESHG